MAQKLITDLQLRSGVTDGISIPADDGIQSYRITGVQIKTYVLAASNVGTTALAALAVTDTKLADNSVTTNKILNNAITLGKLDTTLQAQFVPVGSVLITARATASTGFLMCDGAAVSRTTYAGLFAAIGVTHGIGDGVTTFRIPDYRGRFLRMVDGGAAQDPDRATRLAMNTGGNTGDAVGSVQLYQNESHSHYDGMGGDQSSFGQFGNATAGNQRIAYSAQGYGGTLHPWTSASGGLEARPRNANVNYQIKF